MNPKRVVELERFDGSAKGKSAAEWLLKSGSAPDPLSAALMLCTSAIAQESSRLQLERWWGVVECLRLAQESASVPADSFTADEIDTTINALNDDIDRISAAYVDSPAKGDAIKMISDVRDKFIAWHERLENA